MKKKLLIVDDELSIRTSLYFAFEEKYEVFSAPDPKETFTVLDNKDIDIVLLDQRLGEHSGLEVLRKIKEERPDIIVIAMTAYGSIESSVEAMSAGAYYYIMKPIDIAGLEILMEKALEYRLLHAKVEDLTKRIEGYKQKNTIISNAPAIYEAFRLVDRIKDLDINVLITGESGTGKEVFARFVHQESNRNKSRIEVINCAAIPDSLLESELFGYEKGAFTGANCKYVGKIQMADGGTLFLDEIGDMDMHLQAKLLRVVQDKIITPLGSSARIPVNFRLLSATNKDLKEEVRAGRFREDLFFRLNEASIVLPPLRERKEDILPLCLHFIDKYASLFNRQIRRVTNSAAEVLEAYNWPGNIRELENVMKLSVALCSSHVIETTDLPKSVRADQRKATRDGGDELLEREGVLCGYGTTLDAAERELILFTLGKAGNNKRKTAGILGISERQLHNKLKAYRAESE